MSLAFLDQLNTALKSAALPVAPAYKPAGLDSPAWISFKKNGDHVPLHLKVGTDGIGPYVAVQREVLGSFGDAAPHVDLQVYRNHEAGERAAIAHALQWLKDWR